MQDMLDNARRAAGAMVNRATWEADRSSRIAGLQRELVLLQKERAALLDQLAGVVADLSRRGELTQPALKAIAARLAGMEDEAQRAQASIQTIQSERYQPGAAPYAVGQPHGAGAERACPSCGAHMPTSARFCSSCGARLA